MMYPLRLLYVVFILVLFSFGNVSSDLYLSVHRLEHLAKHEPALLAGFKTYADAQPLGVPAEIVRYVTVLLQKTNSFIANHALNCRILFFKKVT